MMKGSGCLLGLIRGRSRVLVWLCFERLGLVEGILHGFLFLIWAGKVIRPCPLLLFYYCRLVFHIFIKLDFRDIGDKVGMLNPIFKKTFKMICFFF